MTTDATSGEAAPNTVSDQKEQAPSRFKVKVDGEEREVDIDELRRGYEHASAANARMRKAAELNKRVQTWIERGGQGDLSWLTSEFGVPKEKALAYMEKALLEHYEYQDLPEEKKELLKERERREELEKRLQEIEEAGKNRQQAMVEAQAYREIEEEISAALKTVGGRKTPRLVRRLAEEMYANLSAKGERLPAAKALEKARSSVREDAIEFLTTSSLEELQAMPKEAVQALRKLFVQEAKAQAPARFQAPRKDQAPPAKSKRRMSTDEMFNRLEKRLGG